jgi:hypothetical protein
VPAKVKIILVKVKMILTFTGIIHSRVGQPRAGDRHLNVTISARQGCVVVLAGRYFTIGALLSDRSGVAMIRAAP